MALPKEDDDEIGEILYNGEPINWAYWASRKSIEPRQAAILAYSIDPIKWSDGSFNGGQWPDSLRIKIQYLHEWLSDRADSYTLSTLVVTLGDRFAPYGMKEAVQVRKAGNTQQAAPANNAGNADSANDWKARVREIADELDRRDQKAGAWTSNKDMSERVALISIERGVTGPHGQLTAGNILREALQGGKWKRPRKSPAE